MRVLRHFNDGVCNAPITLLKQDHDYVKKAFRAFEKMDHEEELFYPPVRKAIKDEDLMNEAEIEHDSAKTLIRRIERMKPGDPKYVATFTVLGEYVKHHVKEEESEMFPKARRRKLNLNALGDKLMGRKIQLGA